MLRVGLTGGIGSGKSTVARLFEILGVPVYYADIAAKEIMNTDEALKSSIRHHFGEEMYATGLLDRVALAAKVFKDPERLELLNSLTHPATILDAEKWMNRQTAPYAIKEAALIFESGSNKSLDHVIGVFAPAELRISRVMKRDGVTREQVLERLGRQMNEDAKMKLCDSVIMNDETEALIPQVLKLHNLLLAKSAATQPAN